MVQIELPAGYPPRKRRRLGCMGCLGQSLLVLFLGFLLIEAVTVILFPWSLFMGGRFHLLPYWAGVGKMHGPGGDYVLYLQIEPTTRGSRMYAHSNLTGRGYVCSPRGEIFAMHLGGEMRPYLGRSIDGEKIHVYVFYWPAGTGSFITDHRPSLDFRGRWQNPTLILDDHGSLANAFNADGSVYKGHDSNHPYATKGAEFTIVEGSYSDFKTACAAR